MQQMEDKAKCKHIECPETNSLHSGYCLTHYRGGIFASGETYEQYQIIEEDFIDFIKIVPLNIEENQKVYSPVLRDIIIRCCVQIELFFKEWTKFYCTHPSFENQLKLYNTIDKKTGLIKGARNWNFRDYYKLKENFIKIRPIHVRELNIDIEPFKSWTSIEQIPEWWNVYNSIKHDGINSKKNVTLRIALESLAALFTLHCCNNHTRDYLKQYSSLTGTNKLGRVKLKFDLITTPLDSKRYLFKDIVSYGEGIEIQKPNNNDYFRGKNV
jgi:hypothetical protein